MYTDENSVGMRCEWGRFGERPGRAAVIFYGFTFWEANREEPYFLFAQWRGGANEPKPRCINETFWVAMEPKMRNI